MKKSGTNEAKTSAYKLRKQGFSYSEISEHLKIPRSTLSVWLRRVRLTDPQKQKLAERRKRAARAGAEKKILKTNQMIENIRQSSSQDISKMSKRELWLMGIMLYWRERYVRENESDMRHGIRFANSDPHLIKFFLKWLRDIGKLGDEEIAFDIFLTERHRGYVRKIISHWSNITGFPKEHFSRIYFQKYFHKKNQDKKKYTGETVEDSNRISGTGSSAALKNVQADHFGLIRIRVKASSMLARQVSGWIKGIAEKI